MSLHVHRVKFYGDLTTLYNEYLVSIIQGDKQVGPGLKEFWDNWYKIGGETRIKERDETYQKWIAQSPEFKDPKASFAPEYWNTERYKYIRNYDKGPLLGLPTDIEASLTRRDLGDDHLAHAHR